MKNRPKGDQGEKQGLQLGNCCSYLGKKDEALGIGSFGKDMSGRGTPDMQKVEIKGN